jgi:6-phosphogluconolactonase
MIYKVDSENGALTPNDPPCFKVAPGAGPRHFTFHPDGKHAYVINEMGNTIVVLKYDSANGGLTEIQTVSTLPEDFNGVSHAAEVKAHPNGRFLYGSNRGDDSIVIYEINPETGLLKLLGFQKTGIDEPRHFNIDPTGVWCVVGNQDTNDVIVFKVDLKTGALTPTDTKIHVGRPICVKFLESHSM